MSKRIYVGNLSFDWHEDEVRELFEGFGEVSSVHLPTDRQTGQARGFAFVEMSEEGADAAIQSLDGSEKGGRTLRVNEARPREDRGGGGGGGGHRQDRRW